MNYTLNQLRIFLKVVQNQSVTKASEELHLTQPAVSIQLKNFQDQFEIPLTEVIGRKIYVTDFGKEIAEAAEQILQQVGTINYKTLAYKGQLFGKIKIDIVHQYFRLQIYQKQLKFEYKTRINQYKSN